VLTCLAVQLTPTTLDEAITRDSCWAARDETAAEFVWCVVDATNLRLNLRLVLELATSACDDFVAST